MTGRKVRQSKEGPGSVGSAPGHELDLVRGDTSCGQPYGIN
jgi:hypothetical protein